MSNNPPIRPDSPLAQPVPDGPTDEELLELMPETMRDMFSYAAKACSDATGGQVKPGIFRVCLNHAAPEYARAVLQRYGRPAITPIPCDETTLMRTVEHDGRSCLVPAQSEPVEPSDEALIAAAKAAVDTYSRVSDFLALRAAAALGCPAFP